MQLTKHQHPAFADAPNALMGCMVSPSHHDHTLTGDGRPLKLFYMHDITFSDLSSLLIPPSTALWPPFRSFDLRLSCLQLFISLLQTFTFASRSDTERNSEVAEMRNVGEERLIRAP